MSRDTREPQSNLVQPSSEGYRDYWAMEPIDRINLIRAGIPATLHCQLANDLHVSKAQLCRWLGLSPTRLARAVRLGRPLRRQDSERLLGVARLIAEVQQIMLESSDHLDFDAAGWMSTWLVQPQPALDGHRPVDYLEVADGLALLSTLLRRMQVGTGL